MCRRRKRMKAKHFKEHRERKRLNERNERKNPNFASLEKIIAMRIKV
jgi:hypothetical protein